MANSNKVYTVRTWHNGHSHDYTGTLQYLLDHVFGYTCECNGKHPSQIKTIRALLNCLNNGRSYWSMNTSYELVK